MVDLSDLIKSFRARVKVCLAILDMTVGEVCDASGDEGMKAYKFHRVLNSENPLLRDYNKIAKMLGVPLELLIFDDKPLDLLSAYLEGVEVENEFSE